MRRQKQRLVVQDDKLGTMHATVHNTSRRFAYQWLHADPAFFPATVEVLHPATPSSMHGLSVTAHSNLI